MEQDLLGSLVILAYTPLTSFLLRGICCVFDALTPSFQRSDGVGGLVWEHEEPFILLGGGFTLTGRERKDTVLFTLRRYFFAEIVLNTVVGL